MTNSFFTEVTIWAILIIILLTLTCSIHPILIIILLIFYAILICLNFSFWKQTYLFSMLFFLLIISGLLIIFLYFSSLISNEKSHIPPINYILWPSLLLFFSSPIFIFKYSPNINVNSILNKSFILMLSWTPYNEIIFSIYSYPFINLTLIRIIFLLITLFSIIKISSPKIKSLRKVSI